MRFGCKERLNGAFLNLPKPCPCILLIFFQARAAATRFTPVSAGKRLDFSLRRVLLPKEVRLGPNGRLVGKENFIRKLVASMKKRGIIVKEGRFNSGVS